MSEARYFRVGLFVLVGMFLIGSCAMILGAGSLLQNPVVLETAFTESVQGLAVGSPVKLRGVSIGRVSEIGLAQDFYPLAEGTGLALTVIVRMKITGRDVDSSEPQEVEAVRRRLNSLMARGLRLKLISQPLTGISYVEADFESMRAEILQVPWKPEHIYVPSVPSTIETISTAVERLFQRLEDAKLEELVGNADRLIANLADATEDLDLGELVRDGRALVRELQATTVKLKAAVDDEEPGSLVAEAGEALDQLSGALTRVERILDGSKYDLEVALENLRVTSGNLREITDTAREYPSLMILGEPPKRSKAVSP
jgi:ABC-type transporter Mla subunit MlaD